MALLNRLRSHGLALYRLGILLGIGWLLHLQCQRKQLVTREISLTAVQAIFPKAASLQPAKTEEGWRMVLNSFGNKLGEVLTTAPVTNTILGYAGPSDVLIGRDSAGTVVGVTLLHSDDTPKHVALVQQSAPFWQQWQGWNPAKTKAPHVDAVSGASLTSNAIAEGIITRLSGGSLSLRFPTPVSLAEVKVHFPTASKLEETDPKFTVRDEAGAVLGYVLRTSPSADNVSGYSGPTECLVSLAPDGVTVSRVTLRKSYDTESYVKQVIDDPRYLDLFAGRTLATLASLDYEKEQIEGVSGSTRTSYAIAESLKQRANNVLQASPEPKPLLAWQRVDWVLLIFVCGALLMAFTKMRGSRKVRLVWQLLLVGALGIWAGQLLSLALMVGWAQHGFPWRTAPGLVLLVVMAMLIPWSSRRQLYCHHLCPHGAAQSLLGSLLRKRWTLPARWHRWFSKLPGLLLLVAVLLVAWRTKFGLSTDLSQLEPFDAWGWRAAAWVSLGLAVVGLMASLFVPQAYCHYGCPTGALLKFIRSPGGHDRFGKVDGLAVLVLGLVWWISA